MNEHRFTYPTVVPLRPAGIAAELPYGETSSERSLVGTGSDARQLAGDAALVDGRGEGPVGR